jgi:hypothetical protein
MDVQAYTAKFRSIVTASALAIVSAGSIAAQAPVSEGAMSVDGKKVMIRGCVRHVDVTGSVPPPLLFWSRNNVMITGVSPSSRDQPQGVGTSSAFTRVLYWIEDDDDLSKHIGKAVEVKGDFDDFEKGKVAINRDGNMTDIEVDLGQRKEKIRVPTVWLRASGLDKDKEFDIITRRIDVDDLRVIGSCL